MNAPWQHRLAGTVDRIIAARRRSFGRAYATFLAAQLGRLDAAFGPSRARSGSSALLRRNRYRATVKTLRLLGYSERRIAEILGLSPSAVHRLLR